MPTKTFFTIALLIIASFVSAKSACALTITIEESSVTVGNVDTLVSAALLSDSSGQSEVDMINTYLGSSVYLASDLEKTEWTDETILDYWTLVNDESDVYAFDLTEDGGYFLVKTGNFQVYDSATDKKVDVKISLLDTFLFSNGFSEEWAVVDLSDILDYLNKYLKEMGYSSYYVKSFDITKLSHLSEVGDPVPEPATMLLLGTGIACLAGFSRRKRN